MNGKTLGHYRVCEQLGRGGMGEVYVADDLNLNRKVALKFLPDAFTGDPERMARFEREAKLLRRSITPTSPPFTGSNRPKANASSSWSLSRAKRWRRRSAKDRCRLKKPWASAAR